VCSTASHIYPTHVPPHTYVAMQASCRSWLQNGKKVPVNTMFVGQITKRGWVCGNTTAFQRHADDMMRLPLVLPPEARVGTCYSRSFAAARMCTTAVVYAKLPVVVRTTGSSRRTPGSSHRTPGSSHRTTFPSLTLPPPPPLYLYRPPPPPDDGRKLSHTDLSSPAQPWAGAP
jgi:hypothetical protein